VASGGVNITSNATAPSSPAVGDQWYDTANGVLYVRVTDGTDAAWLDISSANGTAAAAAAGGGGAWEVISSTTVSSSVTSMSMTLSGYDDYIISFTNVEGNQSSYDLSRLYFSTDNGATFSSNIRYVYKRNYSMNTNTHVASSLSAGYVLMGEHYASGVTTGFITLRNTAAMNPKTGTFNNVSSSSTTDYWFQGAFVIQESSVIDVVKFALEGNNNASITGGTFTLYGIKNS
jgi:hypothetical protein